MRPMGSVFTLCWYLVMAICEVACRDLTVLRQKSKSRTPLPTLLEILVFPLKLLPRSQILLKSFKTLFIIT